MPAHFFKNQLWKTNQESKIISEIKKTNNHIPGVFTLWEGFWFQMWKFYCWKLIKRQEWVLKPQNFSFSHWTAYRSLPYWVQEDPKPSYEYKHDSAKYKLQNILIQFFQSITHLTYSWPWLCCSCRHPKSNLSHQHYIYQERVFQVMYISLPILITTVIYMYVHVCDDVMMWWWFQGIDIPVYVYDWWCDVFVLVRWCCAANMVRWCDDGCPGLRIISKKYFSECEILNSGGLTAKNLLDAEEWMLRKSWYHYYVHNNILYYKQDTRYKYDTTH